jgi:hypothetical protein
VLRVLRRGVRGGGVRAQQAAVDGAEGPAAAREAAGAARERRGREAVGGLRRVRGRTGGAFVELSGRPSQERRRGLRWG